MRTRNRIPMDTGPSSDPAAAVAETPPRGETGERVLVLDSDPLARETITGTLGENSGHVASAGSGEEALGLIEAGAFDLAMLATELPGMTGLDLLRRIRERSDMLTIVVSADRGVAGRIAALDGGADDCITRPVTAAELAARAMLRRAGWQQPSAGRLSGPSGVELSIRAREVRADGSPVQLTTLELELLRTLLERQDELLSPDELSRLVWGYDAFGDYHFVQACVSRLRTKLQASGATSVITTVRGAGYMIRAASIPTGG